MKQTSICASQSQKVRKVAYFHKMLNSSLNWNSALRSQSNKKSCNLLRFPCRQTLIFQCLLFVSVHTPFRLFCRDTKKENIRVYGTDFLHQLPLNIDLKNSCFGLLILKAGGVGRRRWTAEGVKKHARGGRITVERLPLKIAFGKEASIPCRSALLWPVPLAREHRPAWNLPLDANTDAQDSTYTPAELQRLAVFAG